MELDAGATFYLWPLLLGLDNAILCIAQQGVYSLVLG